MSHRSNRFLPGALQVAGLALAATALTGTAEAQQFNNSPGALTNTANWTEGLECADIENDGDLDVFIADGGGFSSPGTQYQNRLLLNDPVGTFSDVSVARLGVNVSHAKGVTTGDVDGNGWIDALFANAFNTDTPFLYINDATNPGFFTMASAARGFTTNFSSASAQFVDIDNDGDLDVIICHSGASYLGGAGGETRAYENDGYGYFTLLGGPDGWTPPLKVGHMDVQIGDVDNDFDLDFFGPNHTNNHYLMLNDGTGAFTNASGLIPSNSTNVYEAELADLDQDTDLDIFWISIAGLNDGHTVNNFVPDGTLTFTNGAGNGGQDDNEVAYVDYDMDGDLDAVIGALQGGTERMYRNNTIGPMPSFTFTNFVATIQSINDSTLDTTVADMDNDGRYDILTVNGESNPAEWTNKLYLNNGPQDTLPPTIKREETLSSPTTCGPWVVRAQVQDQAMDDGRHWMTAEGAYVVNTSPATANVDTSGFNFVPQVLNITAGTTVTWTNPGGSGLTHTVTSDEPDYPFNSGDILPGGTFSYTFVRPGTYDYHCIPHVGFGMTGQVVVSGSPITIKGFDQGGGMFQFAMIDPVDGAGVELAYEFTVTDWMGNATTSTSRVESLSVDTCGACKYGSGAGGANVIELYTIGDAGIGGKLDFHMENVNKEFVFLAVAVGAGNVNVFGGTLLLNPVGVLFTWGLGSPDGFGILSVELTDPTLAGGVLNFQAATLDAAQAQGYAFSNGLEWTICP